MKRASLRVFIFLFSYSSSSILAILFYTLAPSHHVIIIIITSSSPFPYIYNNFSFLYSSSLSSFTSLIRSHFYIHDNFKMNTWIIIIFAMIFLCMFEWFIYYCHLPLPRPPHLLVIAISLLVILVFVIFSIFNPNSFLISW
jgi:hypothetical protein